MKTVKDLRNAYNKAVKEGADTFTIDGFEFVTGFARYLRIILLNIDL